MTFDLNIPGGNIDSWQLNVVLGERQIGMIFEMDILLNLSKSKQGETL